MEGMEGADGNGEGKEGGILCMWSEGRELVDGSHSMRTN